MFTWSASLSSSAFEVNLVTGLLVPFTKDLIYA
jgi:hypothetical protein